MYNPVQNIAVILRKLKRKLEVRAKEGGEKDSRRTEGTGRGGRCVTCPRANNICHVTTDNAVIVCWNPLLAVESNLDHGDRNMKFKFDVTC